VDLISNRWPDQHWLQLLLFCAAVACLLDLACCALLIVFLLSRALSNEVMRDILAVRVDEETWIGFTAFQWAVQVVLDLVVHIMAVLAFQWAGQYILLVVLLPSIGLLLSQVWRPWFLWLFSSSILVLRSRSLHVFGCGCHYEHFLILFGDSPIVHNAWPDRNNRRSLKFRQPNIIPNIGDLLILTSYIICLIPLSLSIKFIFPVNLNWHFHLIPIAQRFNAIGFDLLCIWLISIDLWFQSFRYEHCLHIYVYRWRNWGTAVGSGILVQRSMPLLID